MALREKLALGALALLLKKDVYGASKGLSLSVLVAAVL